MKYLVLIMFLAAFAFSACQKDEGVFEKAGKKADEGLENVQKSLEDNGD